jgi:hypothetical protein
MAVAHRTRGHALGLRTVTDMENPRSWPACDTTPDGGNIAEEKV